MPPARAQAAGTIGDLIWGVYQNTILDPYASVRLWENEAGELLGFAWLEAPDGNEHPDPPQPARGAGALEEQMLAWAIEQGPQRPQPATTEIWAKANDTDTPLRALLARLG